MKNVTEMIEVMQSYKAGKIVEWSFVDLNDWTNCVEPSWNWHEFDYRIKQVSPLIIPWDAIKPEYKWAAKDADGQVYVYTDKPYLEVSMEWWEDCLGTGSWLGEYTIIQDPDNIDWKDSLLERPSA